jgi:Tfp pilus assembly protein PilO
MRDFELKRALIIVGLAILLAADATFAYLNHHMSLSKENPQQVLAARNLQLGIMKADIDHASKIRENIPKVVKAFEEIESGLPQASRGYSIISQELDGYAHESHIIMDDIHFREKEVSGRNVSEVIVESTITGDYNGIVHFLNHMQRSKNIYIVDGLDVDSQNMSQAAPGSLRVGLHLRTYFRKA